MPDLTPEAMAALHHACFTTPRPWGTGEIASLLRDRHVFALGDSGGFLLARVIADEAEVLTLAVSPTRRRAGIGADLVTRFLTEARARGAATAFLEVSADNHAAIALYMQAGFVQTGRRRAYYAVPGGVACDALVLARAT